ncbi:MAG TPA: ABC transporter ATP-binding protein [Vicinamibacteria bacterium]
MSGLLEVRDLRIAFGGIRALDGVSLEVAEGETVALIGPNGSGKTSLFNCTTGAYRATGGTISFAGESLLGLAPDAVARRGIARTFQNLRLFGSLTVLDNVLVGRERHWKKSLLGALLRGRREEVRQRTSAEEVLEFLDLEPWRKRRAADCPYGVQKRVELARALAAEPRLLLLDEPVAGLTAEEKEELSYWIHEIRGRLRITVLLVEHDLRVVSRLAGRVVALEEGRVIAQGTPAEVQGHPEVVRAYLGD